MDPAEEVLLDPVLVNPFFSACKESYSCATALFESSGGVAANAGEPNAEERDEPREGTHSQNARIR